MLFTQVENNINKDALSFFQKKGLENSEETVDYATVVAYLFT